MDLLSSYLKVGSFQSSSSDFLFHFTAQVLEVSLDTTDVADVMSRYGLLEFGYTFVNLPQGPITSDHEEGLQLLV
jgi:hypothetical protein